MRRRRLAGGTVLAAFAASLTVLTGTGTAHADSSTVLPVSSHWQTVADSTHHHVYISAPGSDAVVATDFDGQVIKTIGQLDGARGMALSRDENTLYVALPEADAIAAVDTSTLEETRRFATGDGTAPESLALAGDELWFSYRASWSGAIGSISVGDPEPVVDPGNVPDFTWYGKPLLASSPASPDLLVAGESEVSPGALRVYDVTSGQTQEIAYNENPGGTVEDLAVTPDGQSVVTAADSVYYHQQFRLSDLTQTGQYDTGPYPTAVAIAPDGTVAAGIVAGGDSDIYVYPPGSTTPARTVVLGSSSYRDLLRRGLAWASDGSRLFAVRFTYQAQVILDVVPMTDGVSR
ncbi:YncE family protein [Streptomyces hokutonensis]|uniref:YncE family protein n=1 Tax=Streptomyces hokutonensis TaxID=1306990 RepID=A0ABW6LZY4_9ACTN